MYSYTHHTVCICLWRCLVLAIFEVDVTHQSNTPVRLEKTHHMFIYSSWLLRPFDSYSIDFPAVSLRHASDSQLQLAVWNNKCHVNKSKSRCFWLAVALHIFAAALGLGRAGEGFRQKVITSSQQCFVAPPFLPLLITHPLTRHCWHFPFCFSQSLGHVHICLSAFARSVSLFKTAVLLGPQLSEIKALYGGRQNIILQYSAYKHPVL